MIDAPETLNIKDLAGEEPVKKAERPFDPKKDIPSDAWMLTSQLLHRQQEDAMSDQRNADKIIATAAKIRVIDSSSSKVVDKITQRDLTMVGNVIARSKSDYDYAKYLTTLRNLRIYDPTTSKESRFEITHYGAVDIKTAMINSRLFDFFSMAASMKIVASHRTIEVPQDQWEKAEEFLIKNNDPKDLYTCIQLINDIKIINPQKAQELSKKVKFSWDNLRNELDELLNKAKQPNASVLTIAHYIDNAHLLSLFASDEIQMTDNGLKLVMPSSSEDLDFKEGLPEVRRF